MTTKTANRCVDCGQREAVVGFGTPPRWICLACFQAALQRVKRVVDAALDGFRIPNG